MISVSDAFCQLYDSSATDSLEMLLLMMFLDSIVSN